MSGPALPIVRLRERTPQFLVTHDPAARTVQVQMRRGFVGAYRLPSGLEYDDDDPVTLTIHEDDPLSARVECGRRIGLRRDGWRTRIEVRSVMSADAGNYHVSSTVDAHEGDDHVHSRTFASTIPRNHT